MGHPREAGDVADVAGKTRVQKWRNSLALHIPNPFAEEAELKNSSLVDVVTR
jgi:antitoxin component of MazEF toxin-antitoxin module